MNNSANVIVNILVNSQSAQAGVSGFGTIINQITVIARQAATQAAAGFNSIFGANFFANIAANMVQTFASGFQTFVSEAVSAASKVESAYLGLSSTAKNLGFSPSDVTESVRGLELVRNGLLTVGDAATATKNLLASGFNLQQSLELIRRFGDTAAFGRQSALTFGYAISSATEGIKNQNSVLVDNAGVTKNLSVILKERGFQIQDISDKTKGASAREALYQGLLKETNVQQGDAQKLLTTTQGALVRIDSAYQRFLASLGEVITKSTVASKTLSVVVSVLDAMARNTGTVLLLTSSIVILTAAVALSATSFTALTVSQISASIAGSGVVKMLQTAILVMTNLQYAAALTAGELAVLSGGFLAVISILAAATYAIYSYSTAQREIVEVSKGSIEASSAQVLLLKSYQDRLSETALQSANVSIAQRDVAAAYQLLNREGKTRVDVMQTEGVAMSENVNQTSRLREEIEKLITAKNEELQVFNRLNAAKLSQVGDEFTGNQKELDFLQARIKLLDETKTKIEGSSGGLSSAELTKAGLNSNLFVQFSKGGQLRDVNGQLGDLNQRYGELAEAQGKLREQAVPLIEKQNALNKELKSTTDSALDSAFANGLLGGSLADAKAATNTLQDAVNSASTAQINNANATNTATDRIRSQIEAVYALSDAQSRISGRRQFIEKQLASIAEESGGDVGKAREIYKQRKDQNIATDYGNVTLGGIVQTTKDLEKANKVLVDDVFPKQQRAAKKTKTEFESLTGSLQKLRGEVQSYTNLSSKEFKLRFEKEELERVKRDFESIIDLRRELGKPITAPLPTTASGAKAEKEQLERVKSLRDEVLKINREVRDAEDKLLVSRLTATAEVVSAQTRADTMYLDGLRARRDGEAQLTADIADEIRRRSQDANDYSSKVEKGQAEAYKDFLQGETKREDDKFKQIAQIQLLSGGFFETNKQILEAIRIANDKRPEASPVVIRLDKSNALLQEILDAVKVAETKQTSSTSSSTSNSATSVNLDDQATGGGRSIVRDANAVDPRKEKDLRSFVVGEGFRVVRTFGKSLNKGSIHPLGLAADVSIRGKTLEEQENFLASALSQGYRVVDERKKLKGIYQSAPHIHLEINPRRESKFQPNEDFYTAFGINRLKNLDDLRFKDKSVSKTTKKPTVSDDDIIIVPLGSTERNAVPTKTENKVNENENVVTVKIPPATRERVNPLASQLKRAFGVEGYGDSDLQGLSETSLSAILKYAEAQRTFTENTKEQVIGVDRLNQALNVNFTQVRELEVAQDQYNRLLSGDAIAVTEVLQDAEIQRRTAAKQTLATLIQANDYLEKLRAGNLNIIGQLITGDDADRASSTAKAFEDIVKAQNFLQKFASGDKAVTENLDKLREASRAKQLQQSTVDVDNLRVEAGRGGRDAQLEKLNTEKEYFLTIIEVGKTEAQIEQQRQLRANPAFVAAVQRNSALSEQLQLERKLAQLEDERATLPLNQVLRERVAAEEELSDIYRDQFKAGEDAVRARVQIADLSVYHEGRANATVLQHIAGMKSLTDIYADAKIAIVDKVWGGLDSLFGKLTSKIPFIGSILRDVLSSVSKLILNPLILRLLGLGSPTASTGGSGGGSNGGAAGGLLSGLLSGGFGGSGAAQTSGGGSSSIFQQASLSSGGGSAGGGVGGLLGLLAQNGGNNNGGNRAGLDGLVNGDIFSAALSAANPHEAAQTGGGIKKVGGGLLNSLFGGLDFKAIGKSLGSAAPALGIGLGASLGGQSVLGQLIGSGGGLLAGGVLSALTAGSLTGATTGGVFGSIGGILGISAGATAGLALAAAPLLLLGSYFLGRNAKRKAEEKQRTAILGDAKTQLQKILTELRGGRLDSVSALTQAQAIRESYLQQVGQLKDKKTRGIAIATVREIDALIEQIKGEGRRADFAKAQDDAFVPTFDGGGMFGYVRNSSAHRQSYNDTTVAAFNPSTEAILNRRDIYALGGYGRMKQAGVRGAASYAGSESGSAAAYSPSVAAASSAGGGSSEQPIHVFVVFDDDAKDKMISKSSGRAIIKVVKPLIDAGQDDGFTESLGSKLAGE